MPEDLKMRVENPTCNKDSFVAQAKLRALGFTTNASIDTHAVVGEDGFGDTKPTVFFSTEETTVQA